MASVIVSLVPGPLPAVSDPVTANGLADLAEHGGGAVLTFDGVVRPTEQGRALKALNYEAYEPMTSRELKRLADRVAEEFRLLAITVTHSTGRVLPGETSYRLIVVGTRRAESYAASERFTNEMKASVPLWKTAVLA